jgi:hypothetical protein
MLRQTTVTGGQLHKEIWAGSPGFCIGVSERYVMMCSRAKTWRSLRSASVNAVSATRCRKNTQSQNHMRIKKGIENVT